jgi:hypothetical protein
VTVDGTLSADGGIDLLDDGVRHQVKVRRVQRMSESVSALQRVEGEV